MAGKKRKVKKKTKKRSGKKLLGKGLAGKAGNVLQNRKKSLDKKIKAAGG